MTCANPSISARSRSYFTVDISLLLPKERPDVAVYLRLTFRPFRTPVIKSDAKLRIETILMNEAHQASTPIRDSVCHLFALSLGRNASALLKPVEKRFAGCGRANRATDFRGRIISHKSMNFSSAQWLRLSPGKQKKSLKAIL